MTVTAVALYEKMAEAESAVKALVADGFRNEAIVLTGRKSAAEAVDEELREYLENLPLGGAIVAAELNEVATKRAKSILATHNPTKIEVRDERWQLLDDQATEAVAKAEAEDMAEDDPVYRAYGTNIPDTMVADFQQHYESTFADNDFPYDKYESAYRFGYDLGRSEDYGQSDWPTIEPQVQLFWEERNQDTWAAFAEAVRFAWERGREESEVMYRR